MDSEGDIQSNWCREYGSQTTQTVALSLLPRTADQARPEALTIIIHIHLSPHIMYKQIYESKARRQDKRRDEQDAPLNNSQTFLIIFIWNSLAWAGRAPSPPLPLNMLCCRSLCEVHGVMGICTLSIMRPNIICSFGGMTHVMYIKQDFVCLRRRVEADAEGNKSFVQSHAAPPLLFLWCMLYGPAWESYLQWFL